MSVTRRATAVSAGARLRRDHYGLLYARLRNYQLLAAALLLIDLGATAALIYFRAVHTQRVHVVEVDHLGNVRGHGPPRPFDTHDERIVRAQLRAWIELARTVTVDEALQRRFVDHATARTAGLARAALNEMLGGARNPFLVRQRETVEVDDVTALPVAGIDSWELQWTERRRAAVTGAARRQERWRALVTFTWRAPDHEEIAANPLGFQVETITWTRLSTESVSAFGGS